MKNQPGYPLPSGELGEDDIVCQLVYLPDRPEYWQAFLGALSYMATWRAWERDVDKRGKDAAANWREAFELTMECWRMTCLEQLQDDVAAILAIMQLPQACCDEGDYTDGDQYTDRVEDGVGDVPQNIIDAGYAEDSEDWDGFDDYKCMIAHVTVSQMSARLREIVPLLSDTGAILGGVAALAGILAVVVSTAGLAIVFGIVAGIGATALLYQAITDFDLIADLADDVDTNHDELACAIYRADGDEAALSDLNDKIDDLFSVPEALVLKNLNLGPTLKMLYAGRYDQQDIADILDQAGYETGDFTCDCEQIGTHLDYTDWESETDEGWTGDVYNTDGWGIGGGWCDIGSTGASEEFVMTFGNLFLKHSLGSGEGATLDLHRLSFWRMASSGRANTVAIDIEHDGGTVEWRLTPQETDWTLEELTFEPALVVSYNEVMITFMHWGPDTDIYRVDNITIDFTPHEV